MIMLITLWERNKKTGRTELVTSHGVDVDTGRTIITSCDHPEKLGGRYDGEVGEWVIDRAEPKAA